MTRRSGAVLFCCLLATPDIAAAHTPIKGIGNLFNGILHPVLTPSHLLLLIAVNLFFGQKGFKETEKALLASIAAVVLGLVTSGLSPGPQVEIFILVWSAMTGLLVAASAKLRTYWYFVVGMVAGFSLGFDSAQESLSGKDSIIALFGSGVGIYFFSLYPFGFAEFCNNRNWLRIGIRVIGSWIAASSLLVLALEVSSTKV
jgi:hydrogenase/urease accessory protein HupE